MRRCSRTHTEIERGGRADYDKFPLPTPTPTPTPTIPPAHVPVSYPAGFWENIIANKIPARNYTSPTRWMSRAR